MLRNQFNRLKSAQICPISLLLRNSVSQNVTQQLFNSRMHIQLYCFG